jgi:hypothetical protein
MNLQKHDTETTLRATTSYALPTLKTTLLCSFRGMVDMIKILYRMGNAPSSSTADPFLLLFHGKRQFLPSYHQFDHHTTYIAELLHVFRVRKHIDKYADSSVYR